MIVGDDAELLRRYVEDHSDAAFGELVQRHINLVFHAALRQVGGDSHRAQDVTQNVFTRLARKAATLTTRPSLAGWLHTTTRFVASELMRAERRRTKREQEAITMHEFSSAPSAASGVEDHRIDWQQLRPVIDDALGKLSERDREAVLMRFFAGLPLAEIGAKLHVTENTARMRIDRALDKLRVLLARRGIKSTASALSLALAEQAAIAAAPAGLATTVTGTALASVASAAAPALGILEFMSTTKFAAAVAGILAILAVGTATHEVLASRAAETALITATRDYDTLVASLRDLEQRALVAEEKAAQLKKDADAASAAQQTAATSAEPSPPAKPAAAWDPEAAGKAFLERHPEVRDALIAYFNAKQRFEYGPLIKALGLSGDQIEQFCAILRQQEGWWWSQPLDETGQTYILRVGESAPAREIQSRMRDLLGDKGYRQLQKFRLTVTARSFSAQVASALYFTDTPLTPEQADELTNVIANSRFKPGDPNAARFNFDWDAITAKARDVLLPPQLIVLQGMQAEDELARASRLTSLPDKTSATPPQASSAKTSP